MAPAALCWCLFLLPGCKEPVIEESELLTEDDLLNLAKDTLYVNAQSFFEVPLNSNNVNIGLVGSVNDAAFGQTVTGFYAQCRITSNNVSLGLNPVLDSAFLMVRYSGTYGKFDIPIQLSAFELNKALTEGFAYKTNDAVEVKAPPIATLNNFTPKLNDSITVYGQKIAPHLRMPLTNVFANRLFTDTTALKDNASFQNAFKGFYLTSSSTTGNGLLYLDLASSISGITFYYHNDNEDSLLFFMPIGGVKFNHFYNNYSGTAVANAVNSPSPSGNERLYVQGGAGVFSKITINGLDSLPEKIAINKAELVLTATPEDTALPRSLLLDLFATDAANTAVTIEDEAESHFGGTRVNEAVNGVTYTRYRFNIRRYFQKLVTGAYPNNGFLLKAVNPSTNSERVVLGNSSSDKNYQIQLIVTYTKL